MFSVSESIAIVTARRIAAEAHADSQDAAAQVARLKDIVSRQAEIIGMQEQQMAADACSVAGYRAYVDHMLNVCSNETLEAASAKYVKANDAKADELGMPQLKKTQDSKAA